MVIQNDILNCNNFISHFALNFCLGDSAASRLHHNWLQRLTAFHFSSTPPAYARQLFGPGVGQVHEQDFGAQRAHGFGVIGERGTDELCEWEKLQKPPLNDCGVNGTGQGAFAGLGCTSWLDYVRNVWKAGMQEEARLGGPRLAHRHLSVEADEVPATVDETDLEHQLVAGHDRAPELRLVEPHDPDLDPAGIRCRLQQPDACRLGQALEDQYPRHDRLGREVAGEEVLGAGDVLEGDEPPLSVVLDDAVHEHERVLGRDLADEPSDLA